MPGGLQPSMPPPGIKVEGSPPPGSPKINREPAAGLPLNVPEAPRNAPGPFASLRPGAPPKTPFRPPSGENGSMFERPAATISWPDSSPFPRALYGQQPRADPPNREVAGALASAGPALDRAPAAPVAPHGRPGSMRETILGDLGLTPKREKTSGSKGSTAGGAPRMPAATADGPPQGLTTAARPPQSSTAAASPAAGPPPGSTNAARPPQGSTTPARPAQGGSGSSSNTIPRLSIPPPHRSAPPPPRSAPRPPPNDLPTTLLSHECQRRRFNPMITTIVNPAGLFRARVDLNNRTAVTTDYAYPTTQDARLAVARKALAVVRGWPLPVRGSVGPGRERELPARAPVRPGREGGGWHEFLRMKMEGGNDRIRMQDLPAANDNGRRRMEMPPPRSGGGGSRPLKREDGGNESRMRDLSAANDNGSRGMGMRRPSNGSHGMQLFPANRPMALEMPAASNHAMGVSLEQMQQMMLRNANLPPDTDAARIFIEGMVAGARATGFFEQALANAGVTRRDRSRSPGRRSFGGAAPGPGGQYRSRSPLGSTEKRETTEDHGLSGISPWLSGNNSLDTTIFGTHQPGSRQGSEQEASQRPGSTLRRMSMDQAGDSRGPTGFAPWSAGGINTATNNGRSSSSNPGPTNSSPFGTPAPYQRRRSGSRHGTVQPRRRRHGTEQPSAGDGTAQPDPRHTRERARDHEREREHEAWLASRQNTDRYRPQYEDGEVETGEWAHDRFRP